MDHDHGCLYSILFCKSVGEPYPPVMYCHLQIESPEGHVTWLPFEYLLARYITHKVHIYDRNVAKRLIIKEIIEDPLDDFLE